MRRGAAGNDPPASGSNFWVRADRLLLGSMEAVLLALVCLSPWAYGCVHPGFEFLLDAGLCLVILLWAARLLLACPLRLKKCPVAACLAGLFLLGIWQLTSLSRPMLDRLAPATGRLYERLLPSRPEVLPDGEGRPAVHPPPGSTLSLYPGATRRHLFRLLAVFLLFAAVRNNLASPAALRRLSVAALVNGVLLSLLGLSQFFSSPHNVVYWTYPSRGGVFGPFINRNHFASYANLCIGLGVGLLLSRNKSPRLGQPSSWYRLLHDPASLAIVAGLALLVSSVGFSLSRGGFLGLVGGALACVLVAQLRKVRSFSLGAALTGAALVVALAAWFGFEPVKKRLDSLWEGTAVQSRLPLWTRSLAAARDFPLWGTGLGTFGYVDPMYCADFPTDATILFDHAHNEYLEILVEAGVPGLGLTLLAVLAVFWLGYRAVGLHQGSPGAGLALGALFGFTALVIQSFGEFAIHIPAVALLATVVCAHLCGLGSTPPRMSPDTLPAIGAAAGEYRLRLWGTAPFLGAAVAVCLGLILAVSGWKAYRVDRLRSVPRPAADDEEALRRRCATLARASSLAPDDAEVCCELARARADLARLPLLRAGQADTAPGEPDPLGTREYLQARDACPLLSDAHLGIAAGAARLKAGDPPADYLRRVKLLAPGNPGTWFYCGLQELQLKDPEATWASWRRSLDLSDKFLPLILAVGRRRLNAAELLDKVLPDRPKVIYDAAFILYPDTTATEERRPFLTRALSLLESRAGRLAPPEAHLKALLHTGLAQPEEAVQAYRDLLARDPGEVPWRFEFARYLYDLRRLDEARHELLVVLALDPKHSEGRRLLDTVTGERLQEKWEGERGKAQGAGQP